MTAKEMTELVGMNAIDPVAFMRGFMDVEDDEAGPGRVLLVKLKAPEVVIGVSLVVGIVKVGKVETSKSVAGVSLVVAMIKVGTKLEVEISLVMIKVGEVVGVSLVMIKVGEVVGVSVSVEGTKEHYIISSEGSREPENLPLSELENTHVSPIQAHPSGQQ
jgi:hypothetical protein